MSQGTTEAALNELRCLLLLLRFVHTVHDKPPAADCRTRSFAIDVGAEENDGCTRVHEVETRTIDPHSNGPSSLAGALRLQLPDRIRRGPRAAPPLHGRLDHCAAV